MPRPVRRCLFVLITGSFMVYSRQTELLVERQNLTTGSLLAKSFVTDRHTSYYQGQVGSAPGGDNYELSVKALQAEMRGNDYVATFLHYSITDNEYTTASGNNLVSGKSPSEPMRSLSALVRAYDLDAGDTVYISGQIGLDPASMQMAEGIDAQTHRVFLLRGS